MKLIVGLGNPGDKYKFTRHNIGFIVADWIVEHYGFTSFLFNKKFNAYISSGKIGKWPILVAKPQTFMNLS
jgi:PTH1 family peptidyl-tRNA hydrolase